MISNPPKAKSKAPKRVANLNRRLVDAEIAAARRTGKATVLWDATARGFGLRVQPNGRARFVLRYRFGGLADAKSQREYKLGGYPELSLSFARQRAAETLLYVMDGGDPARDKQQRREAESMTEAIGRWLDKLANSDMKPGTLKEYRRLWTRDIQPTLGELRAELVGEDDVRRLLEKMADRKVTANRVRARLHSFFGWCEDEHIRGRHTNPVTGVDSFEEKSSERFLQPSQIQALFTSLDRASTAEGLPVPPSLKGKKRGKVKARKSRSKPGARKYVLKAPRRPRTPYARAVDPKRRPMNPVAIAALRFLVFSGWREQEALTLRWDAVDYERGAAALADTKTGKSWRPLSDVALDVLKQQAPVPGNPHVFVGAKVGEPLKEIRHVWYAVRHAAGLAGVRLHDLRHTFASVMVSGGSSLPVIGSALGHKDHKSTQRYAKLMSGAVREASQRAGDSMLEMARAGAAPLTATGE